MRYLVRARLKAECDAALLRAIDDETLGRGSIAGHEYLHDMRQARLNENGVATYSRRDCRHENGTEPWACSECDCTAKLEARLGNQGISFLSRLRRMTKHDCRMTNQ